MIFSRLFLTDLPQFSDNAQLVVTTRSGGDEAFRFADGPLPIELVANSGSLSDSDLQRSRGGENRESKA